MAVVIYDGECGLCSNFVKFLVAINKNPELLITDFSSKWTHENMEIQGDLNSVIFVTEEQHYIYSDAVIHLLAAANPLCKPIYLLKLIPKRLRDAGYQMIARNRKKILPASACSIPSRKARSMYLS